MAVKKCIRSMSALSHEFQDLAANIQESCEDNSALNEIIDGLSQLLSITSNLEQRDFTSKELKSEEITQIGEYGFNLLFDLLEWAHQEPNKDIEIQALVLIASLTHWVINLNGSIQSLGTVVSAVTQIAKQTNNHDELCNIAELMQSISRHCDPKIVSNVQRGTITEACRSLLLNSAMIATRSQNVNLMQDCFDRLVAVLPKDASDFFTQGMRQMDLHNYPDSARSVMQEYFNRYTRPKMN